MTKTKDSNWKIYILTIICFIVGTTQFSIVGMLDKIANSVGVSISTAGQLVTVYALSNAIGTPLVIIAISKLNQRKQLLLALTTILIGIIIMLGFNGFGFLVAARMILGIGTGVFLVNAYAMANKLAIPGREGSTMSNVAMGMSASLVFGVPLGRIVSAYYSWKAIFVVIGVLTALSLILVQKIIPDLESDESIPLSKRISLLKNPNVAIMLSITIFVFIGFSAIDTYITPYLTTVLPKMQDNISMILLILGVGSLIGSKLGGFLADRIGIRRTIFGAMIVQFIALVIVSICHNYGIVVVVGLMIWEIACWTFGPTQNLNLVSIVPEAFAIILSLNSTFVQLGFALGAGIGGAAVNKWSILSITVISAVSVAVAIMVLSSRKTIKKA